MSAARVDAELVEVLFDAAADLEETEARRLLDATCKDAPDLRAAVERLLARDRAAPSGFLAPDAEHAARALREHVEALEDGVTDTTASTFAEGARRAHGPEPTDARRGASEARRRDGAHRRERARAGALRESAPVGRYLVLRKLGEGGMGDVYVAYDESLDRRVALKVLRSSWIPEASLRREAQALARLSHPNVVQIHEIGDHDGRPYVAMELVDGVTLRRWLEDEERSADDILRMFVQCGRGLVAAHEASLVHRDFKPANVIVGTDGRARVLDFGIAALREAKDGGGDGDARPARDDSDVMLAGTPQFMSPEQLAGERVTPASDQFSFSVALYRALYRAPPFAGDDLLTLRRNVLAGALRRPPPAQVPEWVAPILLRGLARHAAARYESLADLLAAIENRLPRDPELDPSVSRRGRRYLAMLMLGCAGLIIAGIQLRGGFGALTARHLIVVSALVFGIATGGVVVFRRHVLANRFGARVAAVVVVGTGTLLVHRVLAVKFGQPLAQMLAVDMLVLGFEVALAALLVQRWFAWSAAFLFGGALVATFAPAWSMTAMVAAVMATLAGGVVAWRRD
ncbi:MAG: serine/threonine protein kinase [Labilithrix sp.]|nr:serine/threonine protein kinase [Labilithrix sp.]